MHKIITLIFLVPLFAHSQEVIHVEQYDLDVSTGYRGSELAYIDSLFEASGFTIFLARLLPLCEGEDCFEQSIIREEQDTKRLPADSLFTATYFTGVSWQLVDTSQLIAVDPADYPFLLTQLLAGPRELASDEVVTACYNPRHAILFQNAQGRIIAIQEICFECGHTKVGIYTTQLRYNTAALFWELFARYGRLHYFKMNFPQPNSIKLSEFGTRSL